MVKNNVKIPIFNLFNLKIIVVAFIVISINLFPQGNPISFLQYLNKDTVWASVQGGGSLLKSTDGGETWKNYTLPESINTEDVFFSNENIGWACGENYLLGTTDGGKNWDVQLYDSTGNLYTLAFANEKLGWVSTLGSKIYHTTDGGKTWKQQADFKGYIYSIFLQDSLHLWAVNTNSGEGAIFYTIDGGKNWLADSTINWGYDIQFVDSLNGWVSGQDKIAHTTNGGKTWIIQINTSGNRWEKIIMADKNHGWALTTTHTKLAVTNNGGESWVVDNDLNTYSLKTILFCDSLNGLAAGWGGIIVKTTDRGINWKLITMSLTNSQLSNIFFIDNSTGWICGYNGAILKTTNSGDNWTKLITNNSVALRSIYFSNQQDGFAVGSEGIIMKTTDGGLSWSSINNGTINWNDIDFFNYPTGWIVGGDSFTECRLIKTTNGGETWNEDTSISFTTGNPEIHFTSKEIGWLLIGDLASDIQQLYKTTDSGGSWNLIRWNYSDTAYYSWQFISDNLGWISTFPYPAGILHTTNGGESWEKYNTPESFTSISFIDSLIGWGASLREIYMTTDGGQTWAQQQISGDQLAKVNFINNQLGFAVGYGGEIHRTTTGGVKSVFDEKSSNIPDNFILYQNYPNPFNPSTTIGYDIPKLSHIKLIVYDILGRKIKMLVDSEKFPGHYQVTLDAGKLASGVYFYSLQAGTLVETRKMILIR